MATTAIREVPTHLPHANFYVDDILEIEEIVRSAYGDVGVQFEYILEGKLRVTTVDELLKHGGSLTSFSLEVVAPPYGLSSSIFRIGGRFQPRFSAPQGLGENAYDLFGRVNAIALSRQDRLKEVTQRIPLFITITSFILAVQFFVDSFVALLIHNLRHSSLLYGSGIVLAISGLCIYGDLKRNRLYLQRHREDTIAKKQRRDERLEKLMWMIFGALLGVLGTLLVRHYSK